MPRKQQKSDYADLGSGTYEIPGVGLIVNGVLLDGDDPDAIAAFHANDDASREASVEAIAERDAVLVDIATSDAPSDTPEGQE